MQTLDADELRPPSQPRSALPHVALYRLVARFFKDLWAAYYAKNPQNIDQFFRLLTYFRPYLVKIIISLACALIVSATTGATAYLLEPVMNRVFVNKDMAFLRLIPGLVIGLFFVKGLFRFAENYLVRSVGERVIRGLRDELYVHYQYLDASYFTENNVGIAMSRITNDVNMMQRAVPSLEVLFREPLSVIGLVGVAFYQFWQAALILFVVFPITVLPISYFGKRMRKWVRRGQERMGLMTSILKETFTGVRVIKAFGMEEYEIGRFKAETKRVFDANIKTTILEEASNPTIELIGALAAAAVVMYGGLKVIQGEITQGAFFSFMASLGLMYEPLKKINRMYLNFMAALAAAARVFFVLDKQPEIVDREGAAEIKGVASDIRFENVRFRYSPEGPWVLDGIDFSTKTGQVIALVGASGSGKTTFVNLIPRFWDVVEGAIRFDGRDIRDITQVSLRRQIGIVTQETFLFADTVKANIAYGDLNADMNKVQQAAKDANAYEFIMELPKGFDTQIGEMGIKISGGQRQRLAIARALYKNAPILILDEATSALDTESEREVQAALERLLVGRTSFVIAHRLSTIQRADRILVIQNGRIVEDGGHDELIAKNGEYARLYHMQFEQAGQ